MAAMIDTAEVDRHFRHLTEQPHPAGSERNYEFAEYVRDKFIEYGLEEVELLRYDVLLDEPREVRVRMVEPFEYEASMVEDPYREDPNSNKPPAVGIPYLSMSKSGLVTAEVIYADSGNPEDYDHLESLGIDPRGKIAIVRYSVPYSFRGFKAYEAQRRGVAALLIYSDPLEDGFHKGEVFPGGPWGPESHIQRGAVTYDFLVPGDPLTPGWASVEGAPRIPDDEITTVADIICAPMSYRDMAPILENLGGPEAPDSWQGGLYFTYRVGPGRVRLEVAVDLDVGARPIWNVIGRVRGSEHPEQMVILGNHRDAWVCGGVDPSSGSATQLELARVLGEMLRQGQRPRRTVVLASWDAEEVHLTGSTEWGEQFAEPLGQGGIAYLNVDSSTDGPNFAASAVATLNRTVIGVAQDVTDGGRGGSIYDAWKRRHEENHAEGIPDLDLVTNELGSGSDYTVFLNLLGIPIVSMSFNGDYGVYYSQYDSYYWVTQIGDPGLDYMTTMVDVWGTHGAATGKRPDPALRPIALRPAGRGGSRCTRGDAGCS